MQEFDIIKGKDKMQLEEISHLLEQTYWAKERPFERTVRAIENSVCYGMIEKRSGRQIGFARVVTDYATVFLYRGCDNR